MLKNKHLYNVAAGRTREVRGPDALELAFAWGLILAILLIPAVYGLRQMRMAEMTEPVSMVSALPRNELIIYRSLYGRWPSSLPSAEDESGRFFKAFKLGKRGSITAQITFQAQGAWPLPAWDDSLETNGYLSFRPVIAGAAGYGALMLLCGYASAPPGVPEPTSVNHTTLNNGDLPPDCRK